MVFPVPLPDELRRVSLLLRALQDEDWHLERDLSRVPDVPQWTYYQADLDEAGARRRIHRTKEHRRQGLGCRYAVVVDDAVLGTAGVVWAEGGEPEIFYAFKPSGRGRGVATEAVRLLTQWLSDNGVPTVALETLAGNTASERVAQRSGFRHVGSRPDTHRDRPVHVNRWVRDAREPAEGLPGAAIV